jgi:hypothetical protein
MIAVKYFIVDLFVIILFQSKVHTVYYQFDGIGPGL